MNPAYTKSLNELIAEFEKLPGIGPKTAERLGFYILKTPSDDALKLSSAIASVKKNIMYCKECFNLSEGSLCSICSDAKRDRSVLCIVEQAKDIISLEKTGMCRWVYHVLGGHIAPLEGVEPSDLTIDSLLKRVRGGQFEEVVMATNPNLEGDGTALYISSLLGHLGVKITRLARGLPTGGSIEFSAGPILAEAILARSQFE